MREVSNLAQRAEKEINYKKKYTYYRKAIDVLEKINRNETKSPCQDSVYVGEVKITKNQLINRYKCSINIAYLSAVSTGDFKQTKKLIEAGANINFISDEFDESGLIMAIKKNYDSIALYLIENGAKLNFYSRQDCLSPLMMAVKQNKISLISTLIKNGADVNAHTFSNSVIMLAVETGIEEIVKLIIENGADINFKTFDFYRKANETARTNNCIEIANLLADANANSEINNSLIEGIEQNDLFQVKIALQKKANPNFRSENGTTPLMKLHNDPIKTQIVKWDPLINNISGLKSLSFEDFCIFETQTSSEQEGDTLQQVFSTSDSMLIKIAELLIYYNANVNLRDHSHKSALIFAIEKGLAELVKLLIDNGANINERDENGKTVLMYAVDLGNTEIVNYLFQKCVNSNSVDNSGKTPLMYCRNPEIAKLLLQNRANVNAKDNENKTALMHSKNHYLTEFLLQNGAMISDQDSSGESALMIGAKLGHSMIVYSLVKNMSSRAALNAVNCEGNSALMLTLQVKDVEYLNIVKNLIIQNVDINQKNCDGDIALMIALRNRHVNSAKLLIEKGSEINIQNKRGETPLMIAVQGHKWAEYYLYPPNTSNQYSPYTSSIGTIPMIVYYPPLVKLLIRMEADVSIKNGEGKTALDILKSQFKGKGYDEIAKAINNKFN